MKPCMTDPCQCCRKAEAGQAQIVALNARLQAKPTFQALEDIIRQADPDVHDQLRWQQVIDDGWEVVQHDDVIQTWLAHGDRLSHPKTSSQQRRPRKGSHLLASLLAQVEFWETRSLTLQLRWCKLNVNAD